MNEHELKTFLATVTPDRVNCLILELEPRQPEANRGTVPLYDVLEALTTDLPVSRPSERFPIEVGLRKAIIAALTHVDGMTFVEGDS